MNSRALILVALIAIGALAAYNVSRGVISTRSGGDVFAKMAEIDAHTGQVVLSGTYTSADTMWLGHPNACTEVSARFEFHAPSDSRGRPLPEKIHTHVVWRMAKYYPGRLGLWWSEFYAKPSRQSIRNFEVKTGGWMILQGVVPQCGDGK